MTSTTFTGQAGHTYGFFSVATDPLGFTQPTPGSAQALTSVTITPTPTSTPPSVTNAQMLDETVAQGSW